MVSFLGLDMGAVEPTDWTAEFLQAESEHLREVAANIWTMYYALTRPKVILNVTAVTKWDAETEEKRRKEGNFKIMLDHGLRMVEIKAALTQVRK